MMTPLALAETPPIGTMDVAVHFATECSDYGEAKA